MRVGKRVLALAALTGVLAIVGAFALGRGGSVNAQTGTATPATSGGGPGNVPSARFFGTVTGVGGAAISPGTPVVALIGAIACGTGAATNGNYSVDVQSIAGCTAPGATVNFTVGGAPATQTGTLPPIQGTAVQVNLTLAAATPTPAPPPPPPPPPPTARATTAPTPPPPPTVAPTAVVPARPPSTGLGGAEQQKPAGPAVAQAARPAAAPALPNTGSGSMAAGRSTGTLAGLIALGAALILVSAGSLAVSRKRS